LEHQALGFPLDIRGSEHLDKDVVPVLTGVLDDLKVRSEIVVDFGFNFLLA
jgi:hypothetical protein